MFTMQKPRRRDPLANQRIGSELTTKTRSEAWVMGEHTPVVMVEGIAGGYALDRVTPMPKARA
jgi:hypothetical protein